jgi:parallel beta-helix repeat protein
MTEIRVSTRSELLSALNGAQGGETIVLADGSYGSLSIGNNYASMVTLRSETPLGAKLDGLVVSGASNMRFDGFHVSQDSNGWNGGRIVGIDGGSTNIEFVNSEVHGRIDDVFFGWQGIQVRGANNVVLENNYVHNVQHGMTCFGVIGLEVRNNTIDYIGEDHMKFAGVYGALIEGNYGGGNVFPPGGDPHPDFMQFQGSSSDVEIRGNVYFADTIAWAQGIFLWDGTYDNILIEGNIISTGMMRGISVQRGDGIVVRDNTLLNLPGEVHNGTLVMVPGNAVVEGNIQTSFVGSNGANLTLQNVDPGRPFYVGDYFVNGMNGRSLTIDDLEPVAGSLAETMGAAATLRGWSSDAPVVSSPQPVTQTSSTDDEAPEEETPVAGALLDEEPEEETPVAEAPAEEEPEEMPVAEALVDEALEVETPEEVVLQPETDLVFRHAEEIAFSGRSRDILTVAHDEAMEIAEGTVGFGFNAANVRDSQGLISKDAAGYQDGGHFDAYVESGALWVRYQDESSSKTLSVGGIQADRDYDVLTSFNGDEIRLYLDGELVDSAAFAVDWIKNPEYLQIGGSGAWSKPGSSWAHHPFEGTISEVAIYNRALAPEELDQLV